MSLVFVYGTLMRGDVRHPALDGQRFVATARTQPRYRLFDCGSYPGLIEAEHDGVSVEGELYEVDRGGLEGLDRVEGVAERLYERKRVELQPPFSDHPVEAYFYLPSTAGMKDCGTTWRRLSRSP